MCLKDDRFIPKGIDKKKKTVDGGRDGENVHNKNNKYF